MCGIVELVSISGAVVFGLDQHIHWGFSLHWAFLDLCPIMKLIYCSVNTSHESNCQIFKRTYGLWILFHAHHNVIIVGPILWGFFSVTQQELSVQFLFIFFLEICFIHFVGHCWSIFIWHLVPLSEQSSYCFFFPQWRIFRLLKIMAWTHITSYFQELSILVLCLLFRFESQICAAMPT